MSNSDFERENFGIFTQLNKKTNKNEVTKICDELFILSLNELSTLTQYMNTNHSKEMTEFPSQEGLPLGVNRSPFPHPKHLFAGVDANSRPGMFTVPVKK